MKYYSEDINELKKKLEYQSNALEEYQNWINMLLSMVYDSNYKEYAIKIKNVYTINTGNRKIRECYRELYKREDKFTR